MKRVTYKLQTSGLMMSKPMMAKELLVTCMLNPSNYTFSITDSNGKVVKEGKADLPNLPSLQKAAKMGLYEVGVVFQEELRNKVTLQDLVKEAHEDMKQVS